jgi:citrate lyase subunit beta / citryl-CoA lyase
MVHADVDSLLETWLQAPPDGIFLKGAQNGADVQHLGAKLAVFEARAGLPDGALGVIASTAGAPSAIFDLASFAGCSPRLRALAFDREALAARLGVARGSAPLDLARSLFVLAAAAANVPALDAPCRDAADPELLRKECLEARRDGFKGKLATTPAEIAVIEEIFTASVQECVAKLPHSAP